MNINFFRHFCLLGICIALSSCGNMEEGRARVAAYMADRSNVESVQASEGAIAFTIEFESPTAAKLAAAIEEAKRTSKGTTTFTGSRSLTSSSYWLAVKAVNGTRFNSGFSKEFEANTAHTMFHKLEPGDYHIYSITARRVELVLPQPISFTVKRGEMSYLGYLKFKLPETAYDKYSFLVIDQNVKFLASNQEVIKKSPLVFVNNTISEKSK